MPGCFATPNGLKRAQARLDAMMRGIPRGFSRRAVEARSLYTVASVIIASATEREESRGAHYRNDFPAHNAIAKHSVLDKGRLTFVA